MKIKNRQQLLAIVAIGGLVLLAGDRLVLTPLTKAWRARGDRITQLRRQVDTGHMLLDREAAIHNRWQSMRTNTLPQSISTAQQTVLRAFQRWERDSHARITGITPQPKEGEDYTTLQCRVDATGDLTSLSRLIYEAERDPLPLKVELVELSARDNKGEQLTLGLQVSGLILNLPRQ